MTHTLIVCVPVGSAASRSDAAAVGFGLAVAGKLGGACDVLLLGPAARDASAAFAGLGVRRVAVAQHADLAQPTGEAHAAAIAAFAGQNYRLIAAASATVARDSLPRVAAKLKCPMASDVVELRGATAQALHITKPAFYSNLLAEIELSGPVVVATCRPSSFEAPLPGAAAAEVVDAQLPDKLAHARKTFLKVDKTPLSRPELTEADVVVSGGRGTKGPDGFKVLEGLADLLGAAVGASRAAVDSGWMPNDFQVGQTGKVVAPKLYIACGISGAIQHLAGMRNSKTIVAINKDPNAPIFEIADFGLVADLFEAVPQMIGKIKAARS